MNGWLESRLTHSLEFPFDFHRRSFNEAEEISNKSLDERDEREERVAPSYVSKCSDETDDDRSVSELIGLESVSLHKCLSNDS